MTESFDINKPNEGSTSSNTLKGTRKRGRPVNSKSTRGDKKLGRPKKQIANQGTLNSFVTKVSNDVSGNIPAFNCMIVFINRW